MPNLWNFLLWKCHTRNKRSQFLTKLTVRSRLYKLMWVGKISRRQSMHKMKFMVLLKH